MYSVELIYKDYEQVRINNVVEYLVDKGFLQLWLSDKKFLCYSVEGLHEILIELMEVKK